MINWILSIYKTSAHNNTLIERWKDKTETERSICNIPTSPITSSKDLSVIFYKLIETGNLKMAVWVSSTSSQGLQHTMGLTNIRWHCLIVKYLNKFSLNKPEKHYYILF